MEDYNTLADNVIKIIRDNYCYLCFKEKEFKTFQDNIKNKTFSTKEELFETLTKEVKIFSDAHIRLKYDGKTKNPYYKKVEFEEKVCSFNRIYENESIKVYREGEITIFDFQSFSPKEKENYNALNEKLPDLITSKIIVDLRKNIGGNEEFLDKFTSLLLGSDKPQISSYFKFREDKENFKKLTDFLPRYITPSSYKIKDNIKVKKIAILISNKTCSAAELCALDLMAINNSIVLGETTNGQTGMPRRFIIDGPNAFKQIKNHEDPEQYGGKYSIDIPIRQAYDAKKRLIQNKGIKPKIVVKESDGKEDLGLKKAISILKN